MARYKTYPGDFAGNLMTICFIIFVFVATVGAWFTHLIWSIKMLMSATSAPVGQYILAAIGAFIPPIGILHGWILWFS